ncbi:MAG: hypothetical protein WC718_16940, partial [Phycisphaerales bacterium]
MPPNAPSNSPTIVRELAPPKLSEVPSQVGRFGDYGGTYVPETLCGALEQLRETYERVCNEERFWDELRDLLKTFVGRPTSLYFAKRLTEFARGSAGHDLGAKIWLKREDLAHTG